MEIICREDIFGEGVPFAQCHASTVLWLPGDILLAAWFAGTCEGSDDVMIWLSRREGGRWSFPVCVSPEEGIPHWNPVLWRGPDGRVSLYYKVGRQIPYWFTVVRESTDGGLTWSAPRELVPGDRGGRGPVKNKPLLTASGRLLAPASIEQGPWRSFIDVSRDGVVWSRQDIPGDDPFVGMIQPTLWEHPAGHIHALLRTDGGRIFRSDSTDDGYTWSPAFPTDMPNNNSGLDCARTGSGIIALVCNPVGQNWGKRWPLTLFLSHDDGKSFQKLLDLEDAPGEWSYPAVVAQGDRLHITYTKDRRTVAYRCITL